MQSNNWGGSDPLDPPLRSSFMLPLFFGGRAVLNYKKQHFEPPLTVTSIQLWFLLKDVQLSERCTTKQINYYIIWRRSS